MFGCSCSILFFALNQPWTVSGLRRGSRSQMRPAGCRNLGVLQDEVSAPSVWFLVSLYWLTKQSAELTLPTNWIMFMLITLISVAELWRRGFWFSVVFATGNVVMGATRYIKGREYEPKSDQSHNDMPVQCSDTKLCTKWIERFWYPERADFCRILDIY